MPITRPESLIRHQRKVMEGLTPNGKMAATARGLTDIPLLERMKFALALEHVCDAFELDLFGGPEAEPEPAPGDFARVPDDMGWEGGWA